jgi:predicted nucleotidyltransferase component of viral defense system
MAKGITNVAASVHQRLLNKAKESSRPFNELLQYFAIERFIYRLSKSAHADQFILKGALMFSAWCGPASRPTMDIDLLGKIDNRIDTITTVMKDVCLIDVEPDGISFNAETVDAVRITEDAEYEGVRARVHGNLGKARISIQIDIGFGDVIVPNAGTVLYPTILDFPAPELKGYTMESTIAEKFQAMVKLGVLNSRMKDYYDIWFLSRTFDFKGEVLTEAIVKTFEKRNTHVNLKAALFDSAFGMDREKNVQWRGFINKAKLTGAPGSFGDIVAAVILFLEPLAVAIVEQKRFISVWVAPGPWR